MPELLRGILGWRVWPWNAVAYALATQRHEGWGADDDPRSQRATLSYREWKSPPPTDPVITVRAMMDVRRQYSDALLIHELPSTAEIAEVMRVSVHRAYDLLVERSVNCGTGELIMWREPSVSISQARWEVV